jgi:hypothetical protein
MNPLNYASREASQRLVKKGIVLDTEAVWALNAWPTTIDGHIVYKEEWQLIDRPMIGYKEQVPAPSMAEVWRELPEDVCCDKVEDGMTETYVESWSFDGRQPSLQENLNPTDALIDLLIWTVEQRTCRYCGKHNNDSTCNECAGDNYGYTTEIGDGGTCSNWEQRKEEKNGN